jgi:hypothetical protein
MQHKTHYATVSEALELLRKQGFTVDFNLEENCIACANGKFDADSFEIVDVYRYEGNTDPADEATVYAIRSNTGVKGVLVTGYGANADNVSPEILKKLH